jgi:hypothetical protein
MPDYRLRHKATQAPVYAGDVLKDRSGASFRLDSWGPAAEVRVIRLGGDEAPLRRIAAPLLEFDLEIFEYKGERVARGITPEETEWAFDVVRRPEFWCRAKLFQALEAAHQKGVLEECLSEMDIPDDVAERIAAHLIEHWK